jgi:UDP-3-O-[3-hydroxymyristoyl] glucosamine N-acyltransferase
MSGVDAALQAGVSPDGRFFTKLGAQSVADLARLAAGRVRDQDIGREISSVSALETAAPNALAYCENPQKAADALSASNAGAVFVPEGWDAPSDSRFAPIFVKSPKGAFALTAQRIIAERKLSPGPLIHPEAEIAEGAIVEPGAVIGAGVQIGAGSRIGANAVLQPGVAIGRNTQIGAGASIQCALIGDDVTIGPKVIVGWAGFGLAGFGGRQLDMPQYGRAIIQDGVSLGAATCIDRGAFGDTVIGEGTKIDNLVHVAHNVMIGRNVIIAACTAMSGSVTVGDGALMGGSVGIADHVHIGAGSVLAARSGVICDIPPGEVWAGYPARPRRQWLREAAWVSRGARRRTD